MFKLGLDSFTKQNLPQDYAEKVLKLEMEIDSNEQTQPSQVQELISLYMTGVEYYESINDKRYFFFQKKLNALILYITQRENDEILQQKEEIQNKRAKFEEESKRIELDLIYSQTESKEAQVKGIVNNHTNHVKQIQSMIQNEMASQTDAFQIRLEKRRKSKMAHSLSQTEIDFQQYNSGILNKQTEFKEQGSQTKEIIYEEVENSRKNSMFQFEQENINYEEGNDLKLRQIRQINDKGHQRYGSQINISQISLKQRFLSQDFHQNKDEKNESINRQLIYQND